MNPDAIQTLRQQLGLSQRELGELVGVSKNTVWNWEHDKGQPNRLHKQILWQLREEARKREDASKWGQFLVSLAVGAGIGAVLGTLFKNLAREPDEDES